MDTPTPPILLNHFDAGKLISMLPARLRRMAKRGEVPAVLLPDGDIRFDPDDLQSWVASHKQPVTGGTMETTP